MKSRKGQLPMWTRDRIRKLRKEGYGERQEDFCRRLGVGLGTLRHWEQGQGKPTGPARILLERLEEDLTDGRVVKKSA